ncbi:MAG: hypothetical protein ABL882_01360 [Sphingopyxis sp.]
MSVWINIGIAALAVVSSCPALADVAARYQPEGDMRAINISMSIEVDENGAARMQMGAMPVYTLVAGGNVLMVQRGPNGPYVANYADILQVMAEAFTRMTSMAHNMPEGNSRALVPLGEVTIGSRQGIAYGYADADDSSPPTPFIVISRDPLLAPIGRAFAASTSTGEPLSSLGPIGAMMQGTMAEMRRLFNDGAPLQIGPMILTDVSFDEIEDSRFQPPSEPISIDALRQMYQPFDEAPTLPRPAAPTEN